MHVRANQISMGLPQLPDWPIFLKGGVAVSFFFVLSGFLITYILFKELDETRTISIKNFYLKRVFRIWPLYFIIIIFGLSFYWYISPRLGYDFKNNYELSTAIILYTFFCANLMNSLYHVGGILNVTWSIAVEEQFYLIWAPLMKSGRNFMTIFISVFLMSFLIYVADLYNLFDLSRGYQSFLGKLEFHYMAVGAMFAYKVFDSPSELLNSWIFRSSIAQWLVTLLLLFYILGYKRNFDLNIIEVLFSSVAFGWLIVNISINPNKIYGLDNKVFNYLGRISYGIYMYHMIAVYLVSFLIQKSYITEFLGVNHVVTIGATSIITIVMASLSYRFCEVKILGVGRNFLVKSKL